MKTKLLTLLVMILALIGSGCAGYLIGFEQGQADGMFTAQTAYVRGGEIVNPSAGAHLELGEPEPADHTSAWERAPMQGKD